MSAATPARITKAEAQRLARHARAHGYHRESATRAYVFCPRCREQIHAEHLAWERPFRALDAAMVDHLWRYDECEGRR